MSVLYTVNGLYAKYEANATSKAHNFTGCILFVKYVRKPRGTITCFGFMGELFCARIFWLRGLSRSETISARALSARSFPIIFMFIMYVHGK